MQKQPQIAKKIDIIDLKNKKVPLYISEKLNSQIQYLCTMIPDVEWSGILFHDIEGNTDNIDSVKLYAQEVLPMNMGTSGYTEYNYDEAYVKHLKAKVDNKMPEFIKMLKEHPDKNRISHIHSHNKMAVFFSGTDVQELIDGSEGKNYYLSLIVNNKGEMCAKIAYRGIIKSSGSVIETVTYKDAFAKNITKEEKLDLSEEKEVMFTVDCDIICEFNVDDDFVKRVDYIMEENKKHLQKMKEDWSKKSYSTNFSKFDSHRIPKSNSAHSLSRQLDFEHCIFPKEAFASDANISDREIKDFIAKVISFDVDTRFGIESLLTNIQLQLDIKQIDMDEFADKLQHQILIAYSHCFGSLGEGYELLNSVCSRASDIIDTYEVQFPFVDIISHELFTMSIDAIESEESFIDLDETVEVKTSKKK